MRRTFRCFGLAFLKSRHLSLVQKNEEWAHTRHSLHLHPDRDIKNIADDRFAGLFCRSLQPFQWLLCQKNEKLPSSYKQFFGGQFDLIQVAFMAIRNWHF